MNQREATRCAHAIAWRLIRDFPDAALAGVNNHDRSRLALALQRLQAAHYDASGDWIDPGLHFPEPPDDPSLWREPHSAQMWLY